MWDESGNSYSMANVVDVLHQILGQLEAAHSLHIVHFDVKLDNIVLADRGGHL